MEQNGREDGPAVSTIARWVLVAFLLTFIAARLLVFLIMSRRTPDLYLHVGGTHVHRLNYGIFLLSGVGGYLLFARPAGRARRVAGALYGVGLALTFDEFGMWLHLGGGYWQRASFDAVVVIAAALALLGAAPALGRLRPRQLATAAVVVLAVAAFGVMLARWFRWAGTDVGPRRRALERTGPQ